MKRNDIIVLVFCLLLVVVFFAIGPLALIFAINTLFDREIPYDLLHWLAALFLIFLFGGRSASRGGEKK